jgi:hypothetical protein
MSAHPEGTMCTVRLVFADEGAFHAETVRIPAQTLDDYDRLVDLLQEDLNVTRQLYVDMKRLVSASLVEEE